MQVPDTVDLAAHVLKDLRDTLGAPEEMVAIKVGGWNVIANPAGDVFAYRVISREGDLEHAELLRFVKRVGNGLRDEPLP